MRDLTYTYLLVGLAVCLSAALTMTGADLPAQAWALVGALAGAGLKRPGDQSPSDLARELENADPTAAVTQA